MCLQWLSITPYSLTRWSLRPDLLPHHINHHIMHSKVWLFLHWPLAGCNPQDPLLDVCGDHVYHRSSPYVIFRDDLSHLVLNRITRHVSGARGRFYSRHFQSQSQTSNANSNICVEYHLLFTGKPLTLQSMTPAWILPVFPVMLSGTVASVISGSQPPHQAIPILIAGTTFQGLGILISVFMYSNYIGRLMSNGLPSPDVRTFGLHFPSFEPNREP